MRYTIPVQFKDGATKAIFDGAASPATRRALPTQLHEIARRKIDMILSASSLVDLTKPPGNRLEALRGKRKGQHSIRINDQYRVCFRWRIDGPCDIEIADYH